MLSYHASLSAKPVTRFQGVENQTEKEKQLAVDVQRLKDLIGGDYYGYIDMPIYAEDGNVVIDYSAYNMSRFYKISHILNVASQYSDTGITKAYSGYKTESYYVGKSKIVEKNIPYGHPF